MMSFWFCQCLVAFGCLISFRFGDNLVQFGFGRCLADFHCLVKPWLIGGLRLDALALRGLPVARGGLAPLSHCGCSLSEVDELGDGCFAFGHGLHAICGHQGGRPQLPSVGRGAHAVQSPLPIVTEQGRCLTLSSLRHAPKASPDPKLRSRFTTERTRLHCYLNHQTTLNPPFSIAWRGSCADSRPRIQEGKELPPVLNPEGTQIKSTGERDH